MRRSLHLAIMVGTALGLMAVAFALHPKEGGGIWPGYRLLLVESKAPESEVLGRLSGGGLKNILSEANQPVQISNYETVVTMDLPEARNRMTEGDVRRDAYVDGLSRWFKATVGGSEYRVYYLRAGTSTALEPRIAASLEGLAARWLLPETAAVDGRGLGRALVFGLVLVLLALSAGRLREAAVLLALTLPWLALAAQAWTGLGIALSWAAFSGLLAGPALAALDEHVLSADLRASARAFLGEAFPSLLMLAPVLAVFVLNGTFLAPALAASAASAFAFRAFSLADGQSRRHRRAFRPVSIGGGAGRFLSFRQPRPLLSWLSFLLGAASLCLLAISVLVPQPSRGAAPRVTTGSIDLPQPFLRGGRPNPSPAEAATLVSAKGDEGELVNAADWLVHRWYQEALFYVPVTERAMPAFASVSVPLPGEKSAALRVFDAAWAKEAWARRPSGGVESLFLAEPAFVECRMAPYNGENRRPLAPITALLYIILLAPPLVGAARLGKNVFRIGREHRKAQ
jgi:hypothetical protein